MTTAADAERPARSAAEWVTFAVSVMILAALMAVIATEALGPERPAAPEVRRTGPVVERAGAFVVPATVTNRGDQTMAEIEVSARLSTPRSEAPEEASQVIDFLAGGESADVEFLFDASPRRGELEIRVSSYQLP